jgi:hypothetical protein
MTAQDTKPAAEAETAGAEALERAVTRLNAMRQYRAKEQHAAHSVIVQEELDLDLLIALARRAAAAEAAQGAVMEAVGALEEAEAILGGEYADQYGSLAQRMSALRALLTKDTSNAA